MVVLTDHEKDVQLLFLRFLLVRKKGSRNRLPFLKSSYLCTINPP